MTNGEIILGAMLVAKLNPEQVVVDTFAGWKRRGYKVKAGEKAVFQTKIWKPSKFNKKVEDPVDGEEVVVEQEKRLILVNASFFTNEQVEKLTKKEEVVA